MMATTTEGSARPRGGLTDDRGSVGISTFFAVMTMILLLGLGIAGMRILTGQGDVTAASRAAARAAAIEHDYGNAVTAANQAADDEIARAGLACEGHATTVETGAGDFIPGCIVTVTVTCDVSYAGLFTPWSGAGGRSLTGTSSDPIDCLRGGADDEVASCDGFP